MTRPGRPLDSGKESQCGSQRLACGLSSRDRAVAALALRRGDRHRATALAVGLCACASLKERDPQAERAGDQPEAGEMRQSARLYTSCASVLRRAGDPGRFEPERALAARACTPPPKGREAPGTGERRA